MEKTKYIYGPVPSRRLGISLGVSPIPIKTCNCSCIYCQLGRIKSMTNSRKMFFGVEEIIHEFDDLIAETIFHVIVIFAVLVLKKEIMGGKGERYEVADNNTDRK